MYIAYIIDNNTNKCLNRCYPVATSMYYDKIIKDIKIVNIHSEQWGKKVRYLIIKKDYKDENNAN